MAARVLIGVTELLQYLPQDSLKALLCTSSSLRRHVHTFVTSITIPDHEDISVLRKGCWPRLRGLSFSGPMLVRSMKQLCYGKWEQLISLDFEGVKLGKSCLKLLAKGTWPLLEILNLAENPMDANCFGMLCKNMSLPHLQTLN